MPEKTLTAKQISVLCDISLARVGQLAKEGVITRISGRYPPTAITQYIKFIRDQRKENLKYGELNEFEKYREKKRQNDSAEKLLVSVHNVIEFPERIAAQINPILESLPLIMKRNWPEITGDQILLVKKAVAECLNAIDNIKIKID